MREYDFSKIWWAILEQGTTSVYQVDRSASSSMSKSLEKSVLQLERKYGKQGSQIMLL